MGDSGQAYIEKDQCRSNERTSSQTQFCRKAVNRDAGLEGSNGGAGADDGGQSELVDEEAARVHGGKEVKGFVGEGEEGELGDDSVPSEGVSTGGVEEEGERSADEAVGVGVGEDELGGKDDGGVEEAEAEEAAVEVAEVERGRGGVDEVEVERDEVAWLLYRREVRLAF